MRLHRASGCGLAFCLIIAAVHHFQLFGTSHRLALKSSPPFRGPDAKATLSQLGEDADWHVGSWSQQHLKAVSAGEVGPTTVKNIWRSKDEAWKGIDDILPTGGGFHYQINHVLNANEAKLVDFVKMARTQIAATISKLPTAVPASLGKESPAKFEEGVKEIKDILSTEQHELGSVGNQALGEPTVRDR
eukprot:CAMPEP_0172169694 /NCGR_PEP_ID=MMETSP1050-20130122/10847_1 /TAXON_ID=233186 /ORGANISM="Cryptomonas curvata, Strain CCAP979/52" /LENGTH=188 /DNA_ID=CAMNT_0012840779 /DNA_START=1 /DNA_END=563 /DNA_ORIENTATION=+